MTLHNSSSPLKGFLLIIVATLCWATAIPLAKHLFNLGILPTDLVQARITYSLIILFLFFGIFNRKLLQIDLNDWSYFLLLGLIGLAIMQYAHFVAVSKINVGVAIAIQYTAPAIIVIYGLVILREKTPKPILLAITMTLIGCYLVIGAFEVPFSELNRIGILSGFISASAFAFYSVYSKKGLVKYASWTVLFYSLVSATLFWNIVHTPFVFVGQNLDWTTWGMIFGVTILGTIIPFSLYFEGLKILSPVKATITASLEPVFATLIAFIFLRESLSFIQIIGGLFIVFSVSLMALSTRSPKEEKESPFS